MKGVFVFLLFLAAPMWAESRFRFDPPLPDSSTAFDIIGTVTSTRPFFCDEGPVTVSGNTIEIVLGGFGIIGLHCFATPPQPVRVGVRVGPLPAAVYNIVVHDDSGIIGTGSVAVQDAAPGVIVSANVALAGDQLALAHRAGIPGFCTDASCKSVRVFFGETEAHVDQATSDRLLVTVPPHAPGVVPVIVQSGLQTLVAAAAFDYVGSDFDRQFFEPVLFPAIVSGPGAYGSTWETRVTFQNGSARFTTPAPTIFHNYCVPPCDDRPGSNYRATVTGVNAPRGFIESVPRQLSSVVFFQERVRNVGSPDAGASIPVVRERKFVNGALAMFDVPLDARSRTTLRMYSIDGPVDMHVTIRPMDIHQRPIIENTVSLTSVDGSLDLAEASLSLDPQPSPVVVSCAASGFRIWGFVSVTNNETQHVTVISPE